MGICTMPSGHGIGRNIFEYIKDHIHLLDIDYPNGKILNRKATPNGSGYLHITLGKKQITVHSLIAYLKYGERCIGLTVNHENGDKTDNVPDNLTIMKHGDNLRHAFKNGLMNLKLNNHQVRDIKWFYWRGLSQQSIADMYEVDVKTVWNIIHGKTRKDVHFDDHGIKRIGS